MEAWTIALLVICAIMFVGGAGSWVYLSKKERDAAKATGDDGVQPGPETMIDEEQTYHDSHEEHGHHHPENV